MRLPLMFLFAATALAGCDDSPKPSVETANTADLALRRLVEGNWRYVAARMQPRDGFAKRRAELANAQKPFAVIICCSDSRVGPEIVFDQGLGDIFVIRTAGEVVDDVALGSIEYAVEHLGSPLVVVLGHERCGAVKATLDGGEAPGHIGALVAAIKPAVEGTKGQPGDALDNAVRAHVGDVVHQLEAAGPIVSEFAHEGKVRIVGARYDLDTGAVEILP